MDKNKNIKHKTTIKHIDFNSLTVKLLSLLFISVIIEAIVFFCFINFSQLLTHVDMLAISTETLPPMNLSGSIRSFLFITLAVSTISGLLAALVLTLAFVSPIKKNINLLNDTDSIEPVILKKLNVTELDKLSKAIEVLSSGSQNTATKMSTVLDVAGKAMAIFEWQDRADKIYVTKHLFPLLGEHDTELCKTGFIPINVFQAKMTKLEKYLASDYSSENSKIFHLAHEGKVSKWIRITIIRGDRNNVGLVEDITEEMLSKTKMEFERDYDILTGLLNRRAFYDNIQTIFSSPQSIKIGAMIAIDLDNLKFVNDNYGHEYGDLYIRLLANILNSTCNDNTLIARLGGDEFSLFMFGYDSMEEIRTQIARLNIAIKNQTFTLPNGAMKNLSASMGISWYPYDSVSSAQLIKYADFAMYSVKKTTKGSSAEFVLKNYEKDVHLSGTSDHFKEFIKNKMFEYTFQPIISAKTGDICAYEAFLKSKHPDIKNPTQLLELAKSDSDLYELELLTWNETLIAFEQLNTRSSVKLFINSISDQILNIDDTKNLERNFCHLLKQLVVEINDGGRANLGCTTSKLNFVRNWGGQIAISDYGTGTYDQASFNAISPKYLKIDISITQNLYRDANRRKLVEGIIAFAHQKNISVVAEGIEKPEDMFTLIDIGVDYLQGYHICKPMTNPPKMLAITTAQITNYNKRKAAQYHSSEQSKIMEA